MGEALGILYNQTFFVGAWNIYLSDECSLLLICYVWHIPATTEMISFLLAGKIIKIQATDCRNYIFWGVHWVHFQASEKHWNLSTTLVFTSHFLATDLCLSWPSYPFPSFFWLRRHNLSSVLTVSPWKGSSLMTTFSCKIIDLSNMIKGTN